MTLSSAKLMSGMIATNRMNTMSATVMGQFARPSFTSETWPLLPVTVVKDLRLPVNHWLMPRMMQPSRMEMNAMM